MPRPRRTAGPHVRAFFREYLRHTKGRWSGSPVECEPWQVELTDELFALDPNGWRVYTDALVGVPRKNSKSTIAAGVGLYLLGPDDEPGAEVIVGSGSREQAGVVFRQCQEFVEANPALEQWYRSQQYAIRCPATNGVLKRVSADGRLQHGLNPSGIVLDELHSFTTPRQEALYEAMVTATGAREQPFTLGITTAGDDLETILGRQYRKALDLPSVERPGGRKREQLKAGLTIARDPDTGFVFMWYGADEDADIEDPAVWMAANPASWVTVEQLRRQLAKPTMTETSFRKLHLNQWVRTALAWLPAGCWPALTAAGFVMPRTIAVGVDVGLSSDTTAVSWAGVNPDDGRLSVKSRVWSARADVPHDVFVPGGKVDLELVEAFIRHDLAANYTIDRVLYDPRFFERSAQMLSDEGLTVAPLWQNSAPMSDAYQEFYTDARTGRIAHDGDPVLAQHVDSAAGVKTERGWKVSKLKSSRRIDACVAACMALYGARRIGMTPKPWVGVG